MRILWSFVCIFIGAGLFLFPITGATYDFRTDVREDSHTVVTASETSGNMTLVKAVYDNDTSTITLTSDLSTDAPAYASYNTTTRFLSFTGLTANTTRIITAEYDIDALSDSPAIGTLLNINPFLWYAFSIVFIGAAIVALLTGRA